MDSKVLGKLEEWKQKVDASPELVEFYRRLLGIQARAEQLAGIPSFGLTNEAISERLERGLPLIGFDELDLDWRLLRDIFVEVASTFAGYPELFGPLPKSIIESTTSEPLFKEAVKAWYEGTTLPATMVADANEHLVRDIIQATVKPFLVSYSKALLGYVEQERWRRGYCPICGGNPDFAFLDNERGSRWLLCCRCDTQWLFQRLQCPYCGNQEQDTLAYFTDDEGLYRLYVCEQCKQYLKSIDLRQTKESVMISLERLFTLGIDAQAQEYGYGRGDKPTSDVK